MARNIGYRIWAKDDRCEQDWELRKARKSLAKCLASHGSPELLIHCIRVELSAAEAVVEFEARFQLGAYAK